MESPRPNQGHRRRAAGGTVILSRKTVGVVVAVLLLALWAGTRESAEDKRAEPSSSAAHGTSASLLGASSASASLPNVGAPSASVDAAVSAHPASSNGAAAPSASPQPPARPGRLSLHAHKRVLKLRDPDSSSQRVLVDLRAFKVDLAPRRAQTKLPGYRPFYDLDPDIPKRAEAIYGPQLSPDERTAYFMTYAWGDSHALYAVDVATRKVRFVEATNRLYVIRQCRDQTLIGKLIVWPHFAYMRDARMVDWPVVIDGYGRAVGLAGHDQRFLALRCGIGEAPVPPPAPLIPRYPRPDVPFQCGDDKMSYTIIEFMDGTRDAFFQDAMANTWGGLSEGLLEVCPEIGKPPAKP